MPNETHTIERDCTECGETIEITVYADDTYEGGHYFGEWTAPDEDSEGEYETAGEWEGFEMAVPALYANPWTAAVPLEYHDKAWGAFMSGMAYRWQESGKILELQEKWDVPRSDWLVEMHEKHQWDTSYLE